MKAAVLAGTRQVKFSCCEVHEKHSFASSAWVVEKTVCWMNENVLANQGLVECLCLVASQSEAIIGSAGKHLM